MQFSAAVHTISVEMNIVTECDSSFITVVDCGGLPDLENGNVISSPSTFQSIATYSCDMGYDLSSGGQNFTRLCQSSANWTLTPPNCIRKYYMTYLCCIIGL